MLAERATAVWRGMIRVDPGAQRTDAFQESRNLLLSTDAHADAIPGLEIEADDVRCTHAAAVAQVDPEQLYYLRSHGLADAEAKRLVIEGFLQELVERAHEGPIRELLATSSSGRLERLLAGATCLSAVRRLLRRPLPPRVAIVQAELDRLPSPGYLEIGVHTGVLFLHVRAARKLGVDPAPSVPTWKRLAHPNTALRGRVIRKTSDAFFADLDPARRFDVIFVDGLHSASSACATSTTRSPTSSADGVVLVHDCNPTDPVSAGRAALATGDAGWCGDVWKAIAHLRANREDVLVETLDTDSGVGVVRRGSNPRATGDLDVARLDYADLEARRVELLGLRAP